MQQDLLREMSSLVLSAENKIQSQPLRSLKPSRGERNLPMISLQCDKCNEVHIHLALKAAFTLPMGCMCPWLSSILPCRSVASQNWEVPTKSKRVNWYTEATLSIWVGRVAKCPKDGSSILQYQPHLSHSCLSLHSLILCNDSWYSMVCFGQMWTCFKLSLQKHFHCLYEDLSCCVLSRLLKIYFIIWIQPHFIWCWLYSNI